MSTTLKKNFLKLLDKDIEFRYAVAGYLGLSEILKRLDSLEEGQNKLFEGQKRIWENIEKLWENQNRLWEEVRELREGQNKLWEEVKELRESQNKLWENQNRLWEEVRGLREEQIKHSKILEEHSEILKEHSRILEEHSKALGQLIHSQGILGMELGALTESTYANFILEDLSKIIASNKENILLRYRNERIDEKDIDLLIITERHAYVVEIKIHPRIEDINELLLKKDIIIKNYPDKEVVPILTGALIGKDIEQYAKSKDIKVYKY
ncbi:MAG: hypothetical protein QXF09_04345 [Nitrososphaerota archaeon]